jgi:hypothetical protein
MRDCCQAIVELGRGLIRLQIKRGVKVSRLQRELRRMEKSAVPQSTVVRAYIPHVGDMPN